MNQPRVVVVVAASCSPVSHAQTTHSDNHALLVLVAPKNSLATANSATWTIEITPAVVLKIRGMEPDTKTRVPVDSMVKVEVLAVCLTMEVLVVNNLLVRRATMKMNRIQRMKGIGRSSVMLLSRVMVVVVVEEVVVANFLTLIVMGGGITRAVG